MKNSACCYVVTLCLLAVTYRQSIGASVNLCQTTRRGILEDSNVNVFHVKFFDKNGTVHLMIRSVTFYCV
jgi:hypothetical protein